MILPLTENPWKELDLADCAPSLTCIRTPQRCQRRGSKTFVSSQAFLKISFTCFQISLMDTEDEIEKLHGWKMKKLDPYLHRINPNF